MKAAKHYKQQWEETQILRLLQLTEQSLKIFSFIYLKINVAFNLILFLTYLLIKFNFNLLKIALFTETHQQLVRDEQWLYRQIK